MTSMHDQPQPLGDLLRTMPLPVSLKRHAPLSLGRRMYSVRLGDTALAAGLGATFDDTCLLTVAEDMDPDQVPLKLSVQGPKKRFTGLHLTALSTKGQCNLLLGDDHLKVFIGTECNIRAGFHLFRQSSVFIGDRTTIGQSRLQVSNADLVIGEDCQIIEDCVLQCNDPHPFIDLSNGELINGERRRMYLGRHVLVHRRCLLMPGVRIGDGAIIQAGALVTHDVQPNTLVGGSPAVTLREQVGWERDFAKTANRPCAKPADLS
jgi:acetyltransferase-like isoleucine patch superfamily enzyme